MPFRKRTATPPMVLALPALPVAGVAATPGVAGPKLPAAAPREQHDHGGARDRSWGPSPMVLERGGPPGRRGTGADMRAWERLKRNGRTDSANTARPLRMGMAAAVRTLALVMSVPMAVAATNGAAVQQETAATAAARAPAAVEASLGLDRPARRLIQQGLRNEGFDPGAPDGLFGPRTRAAIQDWQQSRGAPLTGYLNGPEAELLRRASSPPPAASEAPRRNLPRQPVGSVRYGRERVEMDVRLRGGRPAGREGT